MVAIKLQSLVVIIDVGLMPMLAACANHLASSGSVIVSVGDNALNWFVNTALLGGVLLLPLKEGKFSRAHFPGFSLVKLMVARKSQSLVVIIDVGFMPTL